MKQLRRDLEQDLDFEKGHLDPHKALLTALVDKARFLARARAAAAPPCFSFASALFAAQS
jgi:hypothetical protein